MPNIIEVQTDLQNLTNKKITYANGFYNMFCSVPYDENPWLNPELLK